MDESKLPLARKEGLLVTRMESGEVVVYDRVRDKVHCLNPTVATIWAACDGATSPAAAAAELHRRFAVPADEGLVLLGLRQLRRAHLLEGEEGTGERQVSRREVLQRVGRAAAVAALVPLVTTVVAPTPAEAGTGRDSGQPCDSGYQCRSGICVGGTCA